MSYKQIKLVRRDEEFWNNWFTQFSKFRSIILKSKFNADFNNDIGNNKNAIFTKSISVHFWLKKYENVS